MILVLFPEGRDRLMMSWRDFCGLSNREIGHRLGHADGATVGKRFAQLCRDSDLHHGIQKAAIKVKKRTIDNCKAWYPQRVVTGHDEEEPEVDR